MRFSRTAGAMSLLSRAPRRVTLNLAPIEVAARCAHLPGFVFFDSALESNDAAQLSVVAARPKKVLRGRDWDSLRDAVAELQVVTPDAGLPAGFAAGCVEYDGTYCFGFYDEALVYRHADETWHQLGSLATELRPYRAPPIRTAPRFKPELSREQFCAMIARAQAYIAAGDIYQVSLAHRFSGHWDGDAFLLYQALRHYSPAPYAAFLQLGGRTVLSASPESFLKMSGNFVRTRPIKGTRPRRRDPDADEKSAYDLITSSKEIAELIMITDLERNDLGMVCEYGSIRVPELLKLERFEQVFHLVSTIEGKLRTDVDQVSALHACFPGGSITGAPKKRAREIIAELEPSPRGLYTGAIGWFGFNGESQFSIAIRTAIIERGVAHFHVGAGIVADSLPEQEWQETLDKAAGILLAAERCSTSDF